MFKKLQRQIDRKKAGAQALKYRFDLRLEALEGLPRTVTQCRVVWARGAKVQLSKVAWSTDGRADFGGQQLSQVATIYRAPVNQLEGKEYSIKIEVPTKNDASKMVTFGKVAVDIVRFVSIDGSPADVAIPIEFKVGNAKGLLKFNLRAMMLKGAVADDGMTAVSGMTGLSSLEDSSHDQDLSGFEESEADLSAGTLETINEAPDSPAMSPVAQSPARGAVQAQAAAAPKVLPMSPLGSGRKQPEANVTALAAVGASAQAEENARLSDENLRLTAELEAAEADISKLKERMQKYKQLKKEKEELAVQVKRLERAGSQEQAAAVAAAEARAAELEAKLEAKAAKAETLQKTNAELSEKVQSLEDELQQEQGAGEETSRLKEIYDSRISGLQRQLEEETAAREALEQQAKEEVLQAAEGQKEKSNALIAKMQAHMEEVQIRAAEDLELLEARLLDVEAEKSELEKSQANVDRVNQRTTQEKMALEKELFEAVDVRTELEREIVALKAQLGGTTKPPGADYSKESTPAASPMKASVSPGKAENGNGNAESDEEFSRVIMDLAMAKLTIAEMENEKIKLKRDLYKSKEKYMTVAAKMTKLETKLLSGS